MAPQLRWVPFSLFALTSVALAQMLKPIDGNAVQAEVDPSPRLAALRYALDHGLVVQRDSVVITWDHPSKPLRATELELAKVEARALGKLIGPNTRDTSERSVLACVRLRGDGSANFNCATSSRFAVVMVREPYAVQGSGSELHVTVEVYSPGFVATERTRQMMSVRVSGRGSSWIGTGYYFGLPGTITGSRVPPTIGAPRNQPRDVRPLADAEQRELELQAAQHLVNASQQSFNGFALDPRLYGVGWNSDASREEAFSSGLSASHSSEHLSALGRALGTSAIVDDGRSCAVIRPDPCRAGALPGAVMFSNALALDSTAQLWVFSVSRDTADQHSRGSVTRNPSTGVVFASWRYTFVRSGGVWVVSGVRGSGVRRGSQNYE